MVELKRKVTLKKKSDVPDDDTAERVHLKKKVTIKEKHEQPNPVIPNNGGDGNGPTPPKPPKGRKWIIWLIIIVILVTGGYLWYSNKGETTSAETQTDSTEVAKSDSSNTSKSDSIVDKDSAKSASAEANGNSETPSSTKQDKESNQQGGATTQAEDNPARPSSSETSTIQNALPTTEPNGSLEETANEVVKGIYGNGNVRKDKLGNRYQEVQNRVNEMYRQGLVH